MDYFESETEKHYMAMQLTLVVFGGTLVAFRRRRVTRPERVTDQSVA